jgi:hypothetical protein
MFSPVTWRALMTVVIALAVGVDLRDTLGILAHLSVS